jgi:hypothetical protein
MRLEFPLDLPIVVEFMQGYRTGIRSHGDVRDPCLLAF